MLFTEYAYNSDGKLFVVTDPRGIKTKYEYDMLGRTTKQIEAYTGDNVAPANDHDRITEYTYDGLGHTTQTTLRAGSLVQTTGYIYGGFIGSAQSEMVYNHDLLRAIHYPGKDGLPSDIRTDAYTYNALGEVTTKSEATGATHFYLRNVLGRMTDDGVLIMSNSKVEDSICKLVTKYDAAGRANDFISYDKNGRPVNEVKREYDAFGRLTCEKVAP